MKSRDELAKKIFGENSKEVLDFLEKKTPEKEEFMDEKSIINYTARLLVKEINKSSLKKIPTTFKFWENRKLALTSGRLADKPKNILYVIRLLNGTVKVPALEEPDYDFKLDPEIPSDDEERFWQEQDEKRESWVIER